MWEGQDPIPQSQTYLRKPSDRARGATEVYPGTDGTLFHQGYVRYLRPSDGKSEC
jgi:hypothetical protein